MKARPILFSAPMVNALIDGRKTQTRRVVKTELYQSESEPSLIRYNGRTKKDSNVKGVSIPKGTPYHATTTLEGFATTCPHGKPGDLLWVRETWALAGLFNRTKPSAIDKEWSEHQIAEGLLWYRADGEQPSGKTVSDRINGRGRWRPSIHMPRWASRLTLRIVSVRVERLNRISEQDAIAEGVEPNCSMLDHTSCEHHGEYLRYANPMDWDDGPAYSAKESFQTLWESINGQDSWEKNLYVWVIEFEVIKQNVDQVIASKEST